MFRQGKDGEAFGNVFLEPCGQLGRSVAVAVDQIGQGGFSLGEIVRCPDRFQRSADALADFCVGSVMDGVPGQVELAALPCGAAQNGAAGSAQAAVVVGDDEFDPAQAARDQAFEERRQLTAMLTDQRTGQGAKRGLFGFLRSTLHRHAANLQKHS
jgi:hypothetical protein